MTDVSNDPTDQPREAQEDAAADPAVKHVGLDSPADETERADQPKTPAGGADVERSADQPVDQPKSAESPAGAEETDQPVADVQAEEAERPSHEPGQEAVGEETLAGAELEKESPKSDKMDWYILKVQSNREDMIREGLMRRVAIAGLDYYFGDIIVPTEKVTEFKGGKKRVMTRKLYPGYLVVQMEINDDTWFLVRETPGIGDFTGAAGAPTPMLSHEVSRILARQEEKADQTPKLKIAFSPGDRVKINEGTFESFEGEVDAIDESNGRVTVMINIFGRSTPVELEYWQIESV